jgi:hypothetical protein
MRLVARDEFCRVGGRRTFPHLLTGETASSDLSGECGGGKPARHREPLRRGGRESPVDKS